MIDILLFLVALGLGLWVLWRGAPWDKTTRRRHDTVDFTGTRIRFGDRGRRA